MANRRNPAPLALPARNVQPLPRERVSGDGGEHNDMLEMPPITSPLVPDRVGATEGNGLNFPPAALHIALVIEDLKVWSQLKKSAWLIAPSLWAGELKLHVLLKRPTDTAMSMVLKLAAVDLGLSDATTLELTSPEQIDLGWPT